MNVLLVGLDAACEPVFERLAAHGADLPVLDSIREAGTTGPLESQIPPWTPSAWPSLYTGVNPGKHGVFGFLDFDGYDWDVVNATDVRERALWELLDSEGMESVVVNVPVTHPPREFKGALIPGYVAPEDPACHPSGILEDVREEVGDYRVYPQHTGTGDADTAEKIEEYGETTRMRGDAFRYLAERFDPAFGFVQFQTTDTVFHECPGDLDALEGVYEAVDEQIGEILESCDPETVVVASDHGIGKYEGYDVRLNSLLREWGFIGTTRGGMPSWDVIRDDEFFGESEESDTDSLLERAMDIAGAVGITSQRINTLLSRLGLAEFVVRHVPKSMVRAGTEAVDFPASAAYARSHIECGVRLNVAGRDPEGVVDPEKYDEVRAELIDRLSALETPDGKPAFDDVAPCEEYFSGSHVEKAIDIVVVPRKFDNFLSTQLREEMFGPPTEPYNHKRDGFVALAGAGVSSSESLSGAHLFDVAPTVLAALGLARGEHMDGAVLSPIEPTGERAYPEREARARETTDEDGVEARLSDLGYLE